MNVKYFELYLGLVESGVHLEESKEKRGKHFVEIRGITVQKRNTGRWKEYDIVAAIDIWKFVVFTRNLTSLWIKGKELDWLGSS